MSCSLRRGAITCLMPGALRGERLLLQAADRQHLAGQRDLAGHRDVVAHAARRVSSEASAVAIVMPALGPSFGIAPAGTWMWMSCSANQSSAVERSSRVAAHARERRLRRLLHHVAELAGERELARCRASRVASMKRTSPPTGVHARPVATPGSLRAPPRLGWKRGRPSSSRTRGAVDVDLAALASPSATRARDLAADRADLALEVAHAGLARVARSMIARSACR